ncbi:MAG: hypothetical protein D6677_09155 [Calditrichaeota bacterium]|nr:MAG: hypothetical protein D6677_09155 [Calditrichota bacterium]
MNPHLTEEEIYASLTGFSSLDKEQRKHLEACPACRQKWEAWRETESLLHTMATETAPGHMTEYIMQKTAQPVGEDISFWVMPAWLTTSVTFIYFVMHYLPFSWHHTLQTLMPDIHFPTIPPYLYWAGLVFLWYGVIELYRYKKTSFHGKQALGQ